MLQFASFEFLAFFALVLALNWGLKRWPLAWRGFLLLSSYFFYLLWDIRFLLILFLASLTNYIVGYLIKKDFNHSRKFVFILGILSNVGLLFFFKYYDFFRLSAQSLLNKTGIPFSLPFFEIILPVGLSFYTFRLISYLVDVYKGKIENEKSLLDFLVYVSFFPHLLAGPIARAGDFLIQLKDGGPKKIDDFFSQIALILIGFFKKLVLSSFLVLNLTDDIFAVPDNHSALAVFLAVIAYTLVIYFDFSGYSDMAVGFAGLLGFKSPDNFNFPYLSLNVKEFWRKWHISLSCWIRDYIYIPLGGNRKGKIREHFNLILAMALAGLWHGASWTFVIWGLWHGAGLSITHIWLDFKKKLDVKVNKIIIILLRGISWALTFIFIALGWTFFRSESAGKAWKMLEKIFDFSSKPEKIPILVVSVLLASILFIFIEKQVFKALVGAEKGLAFPFWLVFVILIFVLIFKFSPTTVPPFIYFSF